VTDRISFTHSVSDDPFQYCPLCGKKLQSFQDNERQRLRCLGCGWIHYRNPTAGVALLIVDGEQVLLGQRRDGKWCIPCGHVEWDEDIHSAARREALEELGVGVSIGEIYAVHSNFHDPDQHTVGIWFLSECESTDQMVAGGDLFAIQFFSLDKLPDLAFPTDQRVLDKLHQSA
jgi:8-oxo-dGTP diphosphatase